MVVRHGLVGICRLRHALRQSRALRRLPVRIGKPHHKRHGKLLFRRHRHRFAVEIIAVFAQRFAVVGHIKQQGFSAALRQLANHVRQQVVHAQHRVVIRIVQLRFAAFAHIGIGAIGFKHLKLRRNTVGVGLVRTERVQHQKRFATAILPDGLPRIRQQRRVPRARLLLRHNLVLADQFVVIQIFIKLRQTWQRINLGVVAQRMQHFTERRLARRAVRAGFEHGRCQAVHRIDGKRVARLRVFEAVQILNLRQLRIGVAAVAVE